MLKKTLLILVGIVLIFFGYVSTRSGHFHYERSGLINASAAKIFPYLNNFKLGSEWSPYERIDPQMKKTFTGPESGVGAKMAFQGNKDVGSGSLEILRSTLDSSVEVQLEMTEPFAVKNLIQYKLTSEGTGTRFTWAMSGEGGFLSKLMNILIDCDKMVGEQFSAGIQNLKSLIESKH